MRCCIVRRWPVGFGVGSEAAGGDAARRAGCCGAAAGFAGLGATGLALAGVAGFGAAGAGLTPGAGVPLDGDG